ncbi:uncharacterized protein LACBIDRAFT_334090 [Laccaria bicolor S238N-H82]|uniref:Predicted protein n=1 Tax=Laccaria bicolor (strain S238N-H82 / ATCC MYA-4686) TaxID=486041 RepID=B0DY24_LACBS|nr:uncharacterized protein LACBIDRAFT_334090 [Laccaria bicolor S238N-H82]EDR00444.1 predicted protein [Laccaria bicolor S238N-H82]|eukprot:XP_001888836.1 predicted protein [Laccaria bicolor S238N-H82]
MKISGNSDFIDLSKHSDIDVEDTLTKATRNNAIATIGSMTSELKEFRFKGIRPTLVKAVSDEDKKNNKFNQDAQIAFGLVQILNAWVRAQWKLDMKILAFLQEDLKKKGCALLPSDKALPDVDTFNLDKVAGLTDNYIEEISSCIDILLHSYSSWASQNQSSTQYFTLPGLFHMDSMEGGNSPWSTLPMPGNSLTLMPLPLPKIPEHLGPSSFSEFISPLIASNPDATPPQTSQTMDAKHQSKENHKAKRKAERVLAKKDQLKDADTRFGHQEFCSVLFSPILWPLQELSQVGGKHIQGFWTMKKPSIEPSITASLPSDASTLACELSATITKTTPTCPIAFVPSPP